MRKLINKTSFLGGEAGPLLEGRSDLAQHQLGATRLKNFIVLKGGAITRRPGTRYVKTTEGTGSLGAKLVDFVVNYDSGDDMYIVELTAVTARVIRLSDNSVYTPGGLGIGFFDSGVNSVTNYGVNGPQIASIQHAQSADFLFLVNGLEQPLILRRSSTAPAFDLAYYDGFTLASATARPEWFSVPYRDANISASHTMQISNASVGTGRTLTSSVNFFVPEHVGAYFRIFDTGFVKVTAVSSGGPHATATVTVLQALDSTSTTDNWAEGAWSDHRGWPRSITFYNDRLCFGGNKSQPDTVWASQIGDYFQMWGTSAELASVSGPKAFTLSSGRLNQIQWMVGGKKLTIGTSSSEWVAQFREDGTNLFVDFSEETTHGSLRAQARRLGYSIPFIQRSGRTIREITFDFDSDSYVATDLNLFAGHIGTMYGEVESALTSHGELASIIKGLAIQASPLDILWANDTQGRLYGLTRDKQQQIAAWHSHELAGSLGLPNLRSNARIVSVCVAPSPYTGNTPGVDRVWFCVHRKINGTSKYFVEYMDDLRSHSDINVQDAAGLNISHLDCATMQTGSASVSWSNLDRFSSSFCYVIAQNAQGAVVYNGTISVSNTGTISLPVAATVVIAGLLPPAEVRLLPIEGGEAPEIKGRSIRRADTAAIKLYQTFGLKVGKNRIMRKTGMEENTSFEVIPFDATEFPVLPTFTGVKEVAVPTDPDADGSFALVKDDPWPCTILSISMRVVANEV